MEDFVTVATYLTLAEAEPPRLALEAEGIATLATDEKMVSLLSSNIMGGIKLQVASADAARASEVLAALRAESQADDTDEDESDDSDDSDDDDSDDGVSLKCPSCGAEIWFPSESRGQVETCPECESQVNVPA